MKKQPSLPDQSSFIYNVEVLVEDKHNAAALEQLLHALNSCGFLDYRILSGIQLGGQIDERKANAASIKNVPIQLKQTAAETGKQSSVSPAKAAAAASESLSGFEKIKAIMISNTLIRLIVNKGLGIKLSIPCRIINLDETENLITVYHVDEKQVYTFRLTEIEDFS
ncbi:hypothetical protein [Paenibacillus prosopidis]|uniref:Uncharacterized protein n=1 Tax=Paenibacillus prosopidis TaxID=630520 RepID=A0A368VPE0_9BACL|nr:hypothetical protein [Paenibacillus prosopidis]RCW43364.1 hypothetical protein DFP97_11335 [Paenibacillus prosopidis]